MAKPLLHDDEAALKTDSDGPDDSPVLAPIDPNVPANEYDDASGDEETEDGLNASDEAVRHAAEDVPSSERAPDVPVFDRGEMPDKT